MLILALDSSATASVALARLDGENPGSTATILAARESADTRSHAEVMSPFVAQVLDKAQVNGRNVDAILTGTGRALSPDCAPESSPPELLDLPGTNPSMDL